MSSLYPFLIAIGEAIEEWSAGVTPEVEIASQYKDDGEPNEPGFELHMAVDSDVRAAVAQLAFLKNTDYANDFRIRFDDLFVSADGYLDRLLTRKRQGERERTAAHLRTQGEHLAEYVYTTALLVAESTGQSVVRPATRQSVRDGVRKVGDWFDRHKKLRPDETGNFAPASTLVALIDQYYLDRTSTWLEEGAIASSAMSNAHRFREAKGGARRASSDSTNGARSDYWRWEIGWLGPLVKGLIWAWSNPDEDAEAEPSENDHPPEKLLGEWSRPMSKTEMMTRLHLNQRAFETFARPHGLKKISRQQWQIRLDMMDPSTRRHIETGR